ncbi:FKBP-type peptidyl-prolyl cis-trans isomerase [Tamlana sp. I1]|uniref:FKBP-type peptidyl-prolyl cis-trans isomerase n=1 Tax=Tamlana sp. I1 TaxID=2762061 RepID=UPI0018904047|nr:hypothetical protein [Tamlana sp. I1]
MKLMKISLFVLGLATCFLSCKKDDDDGTVVVEVRDRTEQQIEDKALLLDYLETHYYNASAFDGSNPNPSSKDLIIEELEEGGTVPTGYRLLIEDITTLDVVFAETDYELYYIDLNKNVNPDSPSPTFADNVATNYKGFFLDDDVFDSAVNPTVFDLTATVPAWGQVMPNFHVAETFADNADGTTSYINHGVGIMFVPSGLGYYNFSQGSIPSYTCLIFSFDLLQMYENDHDDDGIPSYKEDWNTNDGFFTYNSAEGVHDGDDTDDDDLLDYNDADDDGDGVLTKYEDIDGDGDPTNDIGKNGIPKYLDPEETESNENQTL